MPTTKGCGTLRVMCTEGKMQRAEKRHWTKVAKCAIGKCTSGIALKYRKLASVLCKAPLSVTIAKCHWLSVDDSNVQRSRVMQSNGP